MQRRLKIAAGVAVVGLVAGGATYAADAMGDGSTADPGREAGSGAVGHGMGMGSRGTGPPAGGGMQRGAPAGMGMSVESQFDYLAGMIPHHGEAIAAAKVLAKSTERQEMRDLAAAIVETQTAEVQQMARWLSDWYPGRDTSVDYEPMMRTLDGLSGDALDRAFLEDMIPHHMMAVMMSQQLLWRGFAEHDPVVPFAKRIRDAQHEEIGTMSDWLADWFGVSAMGGMRGRTTQGGSVGPGMGSGGMHGGKGHGAGMGG
jgi:uncharacterized protein (DUF305 family)